MADLPSRHLKDDELQWFDFDPSQLVAFVRQYGPEYRDLPDRLEKCRRAAWSCGSYLRFAEDLPPGREDVAAVVSNDDYSPALREYAVSLDRDGSPLGVELLHRECYQE